MKTETEEFRDLYEIARRQLISRANDGAQLDVHELLGLMDVGTRVANLEEFDLLQAEDAE